MQPNLDRIGETNTANNGMLMTIIKYNNARDLNVEFENGMIKKHTTYEYFRQGKIKPPTNKRIGETNLANNGMLMTIIKYRNSKDMDVRFTDKTVRKHVAYRDFKTGQIAKVKILDDPNTRIGETNRANNGMLMTIIRYQTNKDMDVQFENGAIRQNVAYQEFKHGEILPESKTLFSVNRIGETKIANNGMNMTIVKYQDVNNVNILFENGMLIENCYYSSFKKGKIGHLKQYENIKIKNMAYQAKEKFAFYVKCEKCGRSDVMTYEQIKKHQCDKN